MVIEKLTNWNGLPLLDLFLGNSDFDKKLQIYSPLLGESDFAWHKPRQQALALAAECYLSNGHEYHKLGFEEGYEFWYEV